MRLTKLLFFSFFLTGLSHSQFSFAQQGCLLEVKSIVTKSEKGRSTGQIEIVITGDEKSDRYKVFLLNQGVDRAKDEIRDRKVKGLKAGYYEFIVIDTKGDKCFKELTVQVLEVN